MMPWPVRAFDSGGHAPRSDASEPERHAMTYETPRSDRTSTTQKFVMPGEATAIGTEDAQEAFTDADRDMEGNELHAAGQTCVRCEHEIVAGEDVRRRLDG